MTKKHTIVLFAFHQCQLLDVAGPSSVFGVANSTAGRAFYDVKVVSPHGGLIATSCGVSIATLAPTAVSAKAIDTILVAGGVKTAMRGCIEGTATRRWLKRCIQTASRFGSVCSGTYILAELGELDDLRVATHWANCDDLAAQFPGLSVDSNSLFVVSGKAWTSAGVSTGIDMALAMVEQDIGRSFAELISWLEGRIAEPIVAASLASRCGLSERTFYRKFVAATGLTPAQFIQNARLERARTLLATPLSLKVIATQSGMGSAARLSLAFERKFGLSPSTFRKMHHVERGREVSAVSGPSR